MNWWRSLLVTVCRVTQMPEVLRARKGKVVTSGALSWVQIPRLAT